ncbi:hypothetical protein AIE39_004463 [Salmonella enterica subsp. enterica serovar Mbandaka]|nr:hypothetical protein [Salmonella enterica subsp. enterica serovar Mbandaka]
MPENPASYRVVRTKSYLFNKAPLMMTRRMSSRMPSINYRGQWPKKVFPRDSAVFHKGHRNF